MYTDDIKENVRRAIKMKVFFEVYTYMYYYFYKTRVI